MLSKILILVLATVTQVDGNTVEIDKGLIDGLRVGDQGVIGYDLTVAGESRSIEVATATLTEVLADSATLTLDEAQDGAAQPFGAGLRVGFTLPATRPSFDFLDYVSQLAAHDPAEARRLLTTWRARNVPLGGQVRPLLAEALKAASELGDETSSSGFGMEVLPAVAVDAAKTSELVRVPAGLRRIGLDPGESTHFDQQPAFLVYLSGFAIEPRADASTISASYYEAVSRCSERGMRLPTEFEWEAAVRSGFIEPAAFYEWTASWYQSYPGNDRSERDYGRTARVLRGGDGRERSGFASMRRFAAPAIGDSRIGFRCSVSLLEQQEE